VAPGQYEVAATWTEHSNRATDAPYTIFAVSGKASVPVNQQNAPQGETFDGQVWENGFRFSAGYNTGNLARQTALQILQTNFRNIDPKFQVEIVSLPWPAFLAGIRASHFPIFFSGWGEDIHDPHNWAQPFLVGTYAYRQNMPDWMVEEFQVLVEAGVTGLTDEERAEAYSAIQQLDFEYVPGIRGAVPTGRTYQQRWVSDWMYNPMLRFPFYEYAKE
jgi:peptide/nickel transport system substrate-binding protein